MEQTKYLGTLSIAGLGMMNDLALQYAHKCNFLTFLSISFAILVTDEGMRHISRCRQLQTLLMQNLLEVSDEGLVAVGSGCGRLQTLDVIGCERVSPRGTDTVVQLCPEMLTVYVDATPSMREWKRRVESNGSTSNVSVKLNFAASS
jgi:F-box/leucine-rich repeat protein 2/20